MGGNLSAEPFPLQDRAPPIGAKSPVYDIKGYYTEKIGVSTEKTQRQLVIEQIQKDIQQMTMVLSAGNLSPSDQAAWVSRRQQAQHRLAVLMEEERTAHLSKLSVQLTNPDLNVNRKEVLDVKAKK